MTKWTVETMYILPHVFRFRRPWLCSHFPNVKSDSMNVNSDGLTADIRTHFLGYKKLMKITCVVIMK